MGLKVLVADDSGVMRKIIVRALNQFDVTDVVEAADGALAWEAFQKHAFSLVLTDWNMPNMTGVELLRMIRTVSDLPVIMVTTEAEKARVMEAIEAGISDYLVKPFEPEALRLKLEKFVPAAI